MAREEKTMRLIDADALCEEFKERQQAALRWKEKAIHDGDEEIQIRADATLAFLCEVKLTIDKAPTFEDRDLFNMGYFEGKRIASERPQGEWIPVSERLPNRNGVYNITRKLKEGETIYLISEASYFDGQNTWYADTGINHGRPYLTDIIAWRPLPKPYKEGEEE